MLKEYEMSIEIDGLNDIEAENTSIEEIDSENINLIFLGIDQSGSMNAFSTDMEQSLEEFKDALIHSQEAEEILVARANFKNAIDIGGYKKIDEFDADFQAAGCTAMYDAIVEGTEKLKEYRQYLREQGVRVKAVFAIFSDGLDTSSANGFSDAKRSIEFLNGEEITTAFISFGGAATEEAKNLGFRNILDVTSSAGELRKAFNCLSKSVIESSKSIVADGDDFFQI